MASFAEPLTFLFEVLSSILCVTTSNQIAGNGHRGPGHFQAYRQRSGSRAIIYCRVSGKKQKHDGEDYTARRIVAGRMSRWHGGEIAISSITGAELAFGEFQRVEGLALENWLDDLD